MKGRILGIAAVLLIAAVALLLFWERDPAPLEDIAIMKREVEEAIKRSEADVYAPGAVAAVRDSLAVIERLVDEQAGRLPFLRQHREVRERLRRLDEAVRAMEAEARTRKDALREEVEEKIQQAIALANEVDDTLANAPRGKEGGLAIRDLRGELRDVRQRIGAAQTALRDGFLVSAREGIVEAIDRAQQLLEELLHAIQQVRELQATDAPD